VFELLVRKSLIVVLHMRRIRTVHLCLRNVRVDETLSVLIIVRIHSRKSLIEVGPLSAWPSRSFFENSVLLVLLIVDFLAGKYRCLAHVLRVEVGFKNARQVRGPTATLLDGFPVDVRTPRMALDLVLHPFGNALVRVFIQH